MFERSLVESCGLGVSRTQRWTALGSLLFQLAIAAVLIAVPLLRPDVLRVVPTAPEVILPKLSRPQVVHMETQPSGAPGAWMLARPSLPVVETRGSEITFHSYSPTGDDAPQIVGVGPMTGGGAADVLRSLSLEGGSGRGVVERARPPAPAHVSSGVSAGMLLTPIQPVYPAIAKAAGVQGAVVMDAVISKAGRIESLRVVSGPEMLRKAALDAVATARYRPYLLNGEAVDVQTTITVVFTLQG